MLSMSRQSKFLIQLVALLLNSNSAIADWSQISSDQATSVYIDPASIIRDGRLSKMWSLTDHKESALSNDGYRFQSSKELYEFDCREHEARILTYILHPDPMGKGKPLYASEIASKWSTIAPDTIADRAFQWACWGKPLNKSAGKVNT